MERRVSRTVRGALEIGQPHDAFKGCVVVDAWLGGQGGVTGRLGAYSRRPFAMTTLHPLMVPHTTGHEAEADPQGVAEAEVREEPEVLPK